MADKERFLEKVKKGANGCWIWQAAYDGAGYGRFWMERRMLPASQAAYKLFVGTVPKGLEVLHTCNNKACCNPGHLRLGTHAENMADLAVAGNNSLRKLVAPRALELRRAGYTLAFIGGEVGASPQAVFQLLERTYGKGAAKRGS